MSTASPTPSEIRDVLAEIDSSENAQAKGLLRVLLQRLATRDQLESGLRDMRDGYDSLASRMRAIECKLDLLIATFVVHTAVFSGLFGVLIARGS